MKVMVTLDEDLVAAIDAARATGQSRSGWIAEACDQKLISDEAVYPPESVRVLTVDEWLDEFPGEPVEIATAEDIRAAREAALAKLGMSWEELEAEAKSGSSECTGFSSDMARRTWWTFKPLGQK